MLDLSGIELKYIVDHINSTIPKDYYLSSITSVTHNSLLLKLHHPIKDDIMLMNSTKGLWITNQKFTTLEENPLETILNHEILRAKIFSIEQNGTERIFKINFNRIDGITRFLIVEIFGVGNIILCDENMKIMAILNSIEVRHRTLKVGLKYVSPPKRGHDVIDVSTNFLLESRKNQPPCLELSKWISDSTSLPKKFVEEIIKKSNVAKSNIDLLSDEDVEKIYFTIKELVDTIIDEKNHDPLILIDEEGNPTNALPICLHQPNVVKIKKADSYMDALDEVLSHDILNFGKNLKTSDLEKEISSLKHDLEEQIKARTDVLSKASSIRKLAQELMSFAYVQIKDINDNSLTRILNENNSQIVHEKGTPYIEILEEKFKFLLNFPTLSSVMYARAKEMERGSLTINEASSKIKDKIEKLLNEKEKIHKKIIFKKQEIKDWYERYRWCITTEGYLAVGGRDASSNSAIIRKHLEESDIIFHAEVHGSPFFIIKNGRNNISQSSLNEIAQATISFSRAWKDGLSSADSYWMFPEQIRKGAPTGQYLPKGSFVIEGKRNYLRGIEVRLAIGLTEILNKDAKRYVVFTGPPESLRMKSIVYANLLPGGLEPSKISKIIKTAFIKEISEFDPDLANFVKTISLDEFIRSLPSGQTKIQSIGRGNLFNTNYQAST